jgi:hypothetical protein
MKLHFNDRRWVVGLVMLWPLLTWGDSSSEQALEFSTQRRLAQEKYEKSVLLCYQKFSVPECKHAATSELNAELSQIKKIEAEKMQSARGQSAQDKIQSLSMKMSASANEVAIPKSLKTSVEPTQPLPVKKLAVAETVSEPSVKSTQEEQAQRKRFEEKNFRAHQHREAHEKRWAEKKGLVITETSVSP